MEILGIGPLELLFILLLVLVILGPRDLEKTCKSIGTGLTKLVKSDVWKTVQQASEKVRSFPNDLMRQAGMEEINESLDSQVIRPGLNDEKLLNSPTGETRVCESGCNEEGPGKGIPVEIESMPPRASEAVFPK